MSELTTCSRHGNKTKSLCSLYEASRVLASFMILLVLTFCGMRLADLHGHGHEKVSRHARRSHTGGLENVQKVPWGRNPCQPLFGRTSPPTSQKLWIQLRTTSQSGSRSNLQLCNFRFKLVRQTGANHSLDGFGRVIGSRRGRDGSSRKRQHGFMASAEGDLSHVRLFYIECSYVVPDNHDSVLLPAVSAST